MTKWRKAKRGKIFKRERVSTEQIGATVGSYTRMDKMIHHGGNITASLLLLLLFFFFFFFFLSSSSLLLLLLLLFS
jgi:hypothetical protein